MSRQDLDHESIRLALDAIRWRLEGIQSEMRALRAELGAGRSLPAEDLERWLRPPVKANPRT